MFWCIPIHRASSGHEYSIPHICVVSHGNYFVPKLPKSQSKILMGHDTHHGKVRIMIVNWSWCGRGIVNLWHIVRRSKHVIVQVCNYSVQLLIDWQHGALVLALTKGFNVI